ncbi:hypothetical protein J1N35_038151 [Gossypium stocksii]|uniref:RNase H type-1 domain-containing protein n=1 Tax=Gossypium stocksii TaxID=47602 RepID=A0A9D3ULB9_9ROSI|nr:hypothetical protein J1N35_038151 [Gossypium stocksii]
MAYLFLWGSRNKLMHEKKVESGVELSQKVQRYMAELDGLIEKRHTLTVTRSINQRDTGSRVTIHFDAAFNKRDFKSIASMVVWDQLGVLRATKTVLNSNVSSSFAAEVYAGLHAVKLRISLGFHSVMIKGDSRTVINKCQKKRQDKLVIGAIISDIHRKMEFFQEIRFCFIKRDENALAHKIVVDALRREEEVYLEGDALLCYRSSPEGRWRRDPD